MVVVLRVELEGEEVIGVDVDSKIGITPDGTGAFAVGRDLGRRADLDVFVIDADDTASTYDAEVSGECGGSRAERGDPAIESGGGHGEHPRTAAVGGEKDFVDLDGEQARLEWMWRMWEDAWGKVCE